MSLRDDLDLPDGAGVAIGIDLGTTYSVVGVCRRRKVEILANDNGSRTTPSIVGFLDGQSYVGDAAKDLPAANQVFDAKRLVGRQWSDLNIQMDKAVWPFEVADHGGVPRITVKVGERNDTFAPEEISAMVLRDLKKTAEAALGQSVSKAVVTVPAYFNERQRQATKDACRIAGLELLAMINEPTAAAIAYGLDNKKGVGPSKTVFIFDLGGGTFDVSIMKISGSAFQVLASGGDTHLGGQDFDVLLLEHCLEDLKKTLSAAKKKTLMEDKQAMQDLRQACELVKRKLSTVPQAPLSVFFSRLNKGYQTTISRSLFETVCSSLFLKTIQISEQVLSDAKVTRGEIDEVVLVGGSTRIPKVRALLRDMFGGKELHQSINPDEAVAYGAAVHAAVLTGDAFFQTEVKLRDVTALSLGISVEGGRFSAVVHKNTPIPCKETKHYTNCIDYQSSALFEVYQGERPLVKDNIFLNKEFVIELPPKPRPEAKLTVTFEINESGLLTVTAVEPTSGRQVQVQVTQQEAHLSEAEIQSLIEKANRYKREDEAALVEVVEELRRKRLRLS